MYILILLTFKIIKALILTTLALGDLVVTNGDGPSGLTA